MHGLIEVDSNRLVINIAASSNTVGSDGDHAAAPGRSRSNDDSDSSIVNAAESRRRGQADDENIYANAEHDMIRKRPPKITKKATTTSDEYDYLRYIFLLCFKKLTFRIATYFLSKNLDISEIYQNRALENLFMLLLILSFLNTNFVKVLFYEYFNLLFA